MNASIEEIKDIIKGVETGADVEQMGEKDVFADVGIDSLEVYNILLGVEEKYGVTIPEEVTEELNSIADITAWLDKQ